MNYKKIYNEIIDNRVKNPINDERYSERHHIVPRSFGGSDDPSNLVRVTPREHFICHYLLTKIYPEGYYHHKAVRAFGMMVWYHSSNQKRYKINSRTYAWLRQKFSEVVSESQAGENNSQYGTFWIYNKDTKSHKKIKKNEPVPNGWIKGRVIKEKIYPRCVGCELEIRTKKANKKYCNVCSKQKNIQKRKKEAEYYFGLFLNSSYKSIREFSKSEYWNKSHVSLTKLWKKYIPLYQQKVEERKPFNSNK